MTGATRTITVNSKSFTIWADFIKRCMFAEDENGIIKPINGGGYLRNELTIRKAIAATFNLTTFRK